MSKRKRDPAFQQSEKVLLIELVEIHFKIIESKKTDAVSVQAKTDEWRKMSTEFNASSGLHTRDWTVIKNCWENLKKRAKNQITQANQNFLATGGGPPKSFPVDPIMERVINLIKPTATGFTNEFDTDGTLVLASGSTTDGDSQPSYIISIKDQESEDIYSENLVLSNESQQSHEPLELEQVHSPVDESKDWSNYSPAMLRAPINHVLKSGNMSSYVKQSEQQQISNSCANGEDANLLSQPSYSNVQSSYVATPARSKTQQVSRRRPVLNQSQSLTQQRVESLVSASQQAREQHEAQMRIFKLQEEREIEMLKQERLRILILKEELKKLQ